MQTSFPDHINVDFILKGKKECSDLRSKVTKIIDNDFGKQHFGVAVQGYSIHSVEKIAEELRERSLSVNIILIKDYNGGKKQSDNGVKERRDDNNNDNNVPPKTIEMNDNPLINKVSRKSSDFVDNLAPAFIVIVANTTLSNSKVIKRTPHDKSFYEFMLSVMKDEPAFDFFEFIRDKLSSKKKSLK